MTAAAIAAAPGKFRSIQLFGKGSASEVLRPVEQDLRQPGPGEVRVKVLCSGVGFTDVIMRRGSYPYAPKYPFTPGYEVVGEVDALGPGVAGWKAGERVAALTVHRGYAEYAYLDPLDLVRVPDGLDPGEVVCLILNYVTAYQMLHRSAQVQPGQAVVVTGAAGGVGSALLELGRLAGLGKMYGVASAPKHAAVEALGGIPIDYRSQDFVKAIRARQPSGVDSAYDAIGGSMLAGCHALVKRGGVLVSYGSTAGANSQMKALGTFARLGWYFILPDGRRATFYGITMKYRKDRRPFQEDLPRLMALLGEKKLKPVIAARMPLQDAIKANEIVEQGQVTGKIVLECTR
ncbi:MAG TPA: medium chain dehydrogenase/reductase family protein [Myxococcales bacterium]|nr:medium chain dehydrogenase/reductase family protein [Myxococcales bacterium]